MRKTFSVIVAILLMVVFQAPLRAMEIPQFDKMAIEDQGDYVQLLLQGARRILVEEGKDELAAKMHKLFTEVRQGDQMSIGMLEFESNLDHVRVLDAERYAKDHNAIRYEVEHAMLLTLKRNGIIMNKSFMHIADNFTPKRPPQKQ